jgi:hypothetical protein
MKCQTQTSSKLSNLDNKKRCVLAVTYACNTWTVNVTE